MHIVKKLLRGLSSQTFKLALFFMATSAATIAILGSPVPIKQVLHDSGLYTKVVGSVMENAKRQQAEEQAKNPAAKSGNLDLNDPAIQKAVQDALPPEYLEQTANGALDGLFDWLEGKTETPQITIDLTQPKQKLAAGIGEATYNKLASKPRCTTAQLRTLDRNNKDIASLPCIPPGMDLRATQAQIVNKINTSDQFLKDTTITTDELTAASGKQGIDFEKLDKVPLAFKIFSLGAVIWGVVAVLSGGLLLLLHDERRRGLWVISRALLMTGIVVLAGVLMVTILANQVRPAADNQNDLVLLVPDIVKVIAAKFNKVLIIFGAIYVVVGAGGLLALRQTRPKQVTAPAKIKK